jgi:beta-phosphoglucomutase
MTSEHNFSKPPHKPVGSVAEDFFGQEELQRRLPKKHFFVWDFDGSFCDTEPIHYQAYLKAFEQYGHVISEEEYYVRFTQNSDGIRLECEAYGLKIGPDEQLEIRRRKVAHYNTLIRSGLARPFPEIASILAATAALDIPWLIASNSPATENSLIIEQLGTPFDSCRIILEPNKTLRKKPEPDLFLEAISRSGFEPEQILVIEDTEKGLQAAAAAGLDAICVSTRYNNGLTLSAPHLARPTHAQLLRTLKALHAQKALRASTSSKKD